MTIEKAAGLGLATSLASIVASIARSKTSAIFLGPAGVGMAAEIQQVAALGLVPLAAFSGPALVQALGRNRQAGAATTAAALSWALILGAGLAVLLAATSPWVLPSNWSSGQQPLVGLACGALLLSAVTNIATQTLIVEGRLGTTTRLGLLTTVTGAFLVASLTAFFNLSGLFLALIATPALLLPWYLRSARASSLWPSIRQLPNFDRTFLRSALATGAASLIAGMALQGALYAIRWRLELTGGAELNGQFQAAWAIGSVYLGMILTGIGNFTFPRYAAASTTEVLQAAVDDAARFVRRLAPPVVLLAVTFAPLLVRLLYSSRFDIAVDILRWQLAGDVAKCIAWVYAGPLLFRGRIRAYLATEFLAATLLAGLTWLLVPWAGPQGAGLAYFGTYVLYAPLSALGSFLSLGVVPRRADLATAAASTVGLSVVAAVPAKPVAQLAAIAFALVWLWRCGLMASALASIRAHLQRLQ